MPSYSSGVHMPRNPSRPISAIAARGNSHVRSHSAANGSIFSFANSRASSTTCSRMSVAVDIEPHARFSAEPSRRDHLPEQPRRPVFQVAEAVLQYLHDREADVEPNQVRERERPQRMLHAQRHHLIHRSEEHTSELQSPYVISYAVFCLKKKKNEEHSERTLLRHWSHGVALSVRSH